VNFWSKHFFSLLAITFFVIACDLNHPSAENFSGTDEKVANKVISVDINADTIANATKGKLCTGEACFEKPPNPKAKPESKEGWQQIQNILSNEGNIGDHFGSSVSLSGNFALIGAEDDDDDGASSGSANIFERQVDGTWIETAKLTAKDATSGDSFGNSVSLYEDRALIGAYLDGGEDMGIGSAYIFERQADGTWIETAHLVATDGAKGDQFGISVSLSGNLALVGAHLTNGMGPDMGAAYIFEKQADGKWVETTKLTARDGVQGDSFGCSVSLSFDRAVLGSCGVDRLGPDNGAAYVFDQQDDGSWLETAKLTASDGTEYANFGNSVSLSSDRVLIGANLEDAKGADTGAAYVFEKKTDGTWLEVAKLSTNNSTPGDKFGYSVALSGDQALIGTAFDDEKGAESGSAYLFVRTDDGKWIQTKQYFATDAEKEDRFGYSVAISGNEILVGASRNNDMGPYSGSVYFFECSGESCTGPQKVLLTEQQSPRDLLPTPIAPEDLLPEQIIPKDLLTEQQSPEDLLTSHQVLLDEGL